MPSMIRWLTAVTLVGTALPGLHTAVSGEEGVTFRYSIYRGDFIQEDPAINANPPDYVGILGFSRVQHPGINTFNASLLTSSSLCP